MSALRPKADIRQRIEHVCLVPLADIVGLNRNHDLALPPWLIAGPIEHSASSPRTAINAFPTFRPGGKAIIRLLGIAGRADQGDEHERHGSIGRRCKTKSATE